MAGYLGLMLPWIDFEDRSQKLFDEEGITFFHSKEFYDTKGEFAGWSRTRKEGFVHKGQDLALGRLDLAITYSTHKAAFRKAKAEHSLAQNESPFGNCFRSIVIGLTENEIVKGALAIGENLSFILESGEYNAADAMRIFCEIKKMTPERDRIMYSFAFADKKQTIGLQFADLLAVTSRRHINLSDKQGSFAQEPPILSILRDRIYLIDDVAVQFEPAARTKRLG